MTALILDEEAEEQVKKEVTSKKQGMGRTSGMDGKNLQKGQSSTEVLSFYEYNRMSEHSFNLLCLI